MTTPPFPCPPPLEDALVSGGYEADMQMFDRNTGLQLVCSAVAAMQELKDR